MVVCECGCGTGIAPQTYTRTNRPGVVTVQRRYVFGHHRRGKHFTPEQTLRRKHIFNTSERFKRASTLSGLKRRGSKRPEMTGPNHFAWKGGVRRNGRGASSQQNTWAKQVKRRDKYTCQDCGTTEQVAAHHIFPYATYAHLRDNPHNGLTLCSVCHTRVHRCLRISEAQRQHAIAV